MSTRGCRRPGFTLIEMLVVMVVFGLVLTVVLGSLATAVRAFSQGARRADVTQTQLFVTSTLQRDLRTAGTNVPQNQPFLVYLGPDVVAFHADYTSNVGDPFAVIQDPDAPNGEVSAPTTITASIIPGTALSWPLVDYVDSPAELITWYFRPDSSTSRGDDFVLLRRVNAAAPEVVSENLLRMPGLPFFQFMRVTDTMVVAIPADSVPLFHTQPLHQSAADTGRLARIDSVRAIRFNLSVTNGRSGADQQILSNTYTVWLRNAGLFTRRTCGSPPLYNTAPTLTARIEDMTPVVDISWPASVDEASGEHDVIRYVIWRSLVTDPMPADPFLSIPAGLANYTFTDRNVVGGETMRYTLAAQDCTPSLSSKSSAVITVPISSP